MQTAPQHQAVFPGSPVCHTAPQESLFQQQKLRNFVKTLYLHVHLSNLSAMIPQSARLSLEVANRPTFVRLHYLNCAATKV